jgi:hypothetical protein
MSIETVNNESAVTTPASERWIELIGQFAKTIKRDLAALEAVLVEEVESRDDDALDILASTPVDAFVRWLTKEPVNAKSAMVIAAVTNLHNALRVAKPVPHVSEVAHPVASVGPNMMTNLLRLPSDASAFDALVVGGALSEGLSSMDPVAAIEAAMADDISLHKVPGVLVNMIERHLKSRRRRPTNPGEIFKLIREVQQHKYSDFLKGTGLSSDIVTQAERDSLMSAMRTTFWPALRSHWAKLHAWFEATSNMNNNMGSMANVLMATMTGNVAAAQAAMPQADLTLLRDATSEIVEATNELFSGLYTYYVARALAGEVRRIAGYFDPEGAKFAAILANTGLPDREALLQDSGASVTDAWKRNKTAVQEYAVNALEARNKGDAELYAFGVQLHTLGLTVPWADLGQPTIANSSIRREPVQPSRVRVDGTHRPFNEVIMQTRR